MTHFDGNEPGGMRPVICKRGKNNSQQVDCVLVPATRVSSSPSDKPISVFEKIADELLPSGMSEKIGKEECAFNLIEEATRPRCRSYGFGGNKCFDTFGLLLFCCIVGVLDADLGMYNLEPTVDFFVTALIGED